MSLDSAWSLDLPAAESLLWTKLFTVDKYTTCIWVGAMSDPESIQPSDICRRVLALAA